MTPPSPLWRCREGRWVGGVACGLARRLGVGVGWVRAVFVIGAAFPILPGLPLYLLLWLLVPREPEPDESPSDIPPG